MTNKVGQAVKGGLRHPAWLNPSEGEQVVDRSDYVVSPQPPQRRGWKDYIKPALLFLTELVKWKRSQK